MAWSRTCSLQSRDAPLHCARESSVGLRAARAAQLICSGHAWTLTIRPLEREWTVRRDRDAVACGCCCAQVPTRAQIRPRRPARSLPAASRLERARTSRARARPREREPNRMREPTRERLQALETSPDKALPTPVAAHAALPRRAARNPAHPEAAHKPTLLRLAARNPVPLEAADELATAALRLAAHYPRLLEAAHKPTLLQQAACTPVLLEAAHKPIPTLPQEAARPPRAKLEAAHKRGAARSLPTVQRETPATTRPQRAREELRATPLPAAPLPHPKSSCRPRAVPARSCATAT